MSVTSAREGYLVFATGSIFHQSLCDLCRRGAPCRIGARWSHSTDARSIRLDNVAAAAFAPRWRVVQERIWATRLDAALLKTVAY